jgi:hypothetical protein
MAMFDFECGFVFVPYFLQRENTGNDKLQEKYTNDHIRERE